MRRLYLLLLFFLPVSLRAQMSKPDIFFIPSMPVIVNKDRPALLNIINKELSVSRDIRQVYLILDKYLRSYNRLSILVCREKPKGHLERYQYLSGNASFGSMDLSNITAARGDTEDTIYERFQFEGYFKDTLAIWDTLQVKLLPAGFYVPTAGLFGGSIQYTVSRDKQFHLTSTEQGKFIAVDYRLPGFVVRRCVFYFLTEEDKTELRNVAASLALGVGDHPPDDEQIQHFGLSRYIRQRFGIIRGWEPQQSISK